jgi:hypothetical protein
MGWYGHVSEIYAWHTMDYEIPTSAMEMGAKTYIKGTPSTAILTLAEFSIIMQNVQHSVY